jgi:hypothetical protein
MYAALQKSGNKHEMTYTPASGGHAQNYTGSLDFFKKALAANKNGCLDPKSPRFDSLATYCDSCKCDEQTAVAPVSAPVKAVVSIGYSKSINGAAETVSILSSGRHTLQVFNVSGAKVMSVSGLGKTTYSLRDVKRGVYFVKVSADGITKIGKIARF